MTKPHDDDNWQSLGTVAQSIVSRLAPPQYPKRNDMPGLKAMTERHQKRIAEIEAEERL
jgi:hypothetical protein